MRPDNAPPPRLSEAEQLEAAVAGAATYDHREGAQDALQRHYERQRLPTGDDEVRQKEANLLASQAKAYTPNLAFDRFLAWKDADDPRFDALDGQTRISLGYYAAAKAAAKELKARG